MAGKQILDKNEGSKKDLADNAAPQQTENITGRGVFVIETVPVGISVRTAFLAEDGRVLDMPAIFPDIVYAMSQIDELRQHVLRRFSEAAQVGSQVIAQQIEKNRTQSVEPDQKVESSSSLTQVETSTYGLNGLSKDSGREPLKGDKASKLN